MSLVRNFTRRARAHTRGEEIPRSCSVKYQPGTINRAKISMPTELLSTTNVQALQAPDIRRTSADTPDSSSESIHSDDLSSIDKGFNSSVSDLSPITPSTPFADSINEKDFFASKPLITSAAPVPSTQGNPTLPKRAPSHSKHAHELISRENTYKRSMSPPPTSITEQVSEPSHPFGRELAKVAEVAESFAAPKIVDEEEEEMMSKGLHKFSVNDYLAEITGLSGGVYEDKITLNPWI